MRPAPILLVVALAGGFLLGCGNRTVLQVPPQVDLYSFDVIGVVEFSSESKGTLAPFATQRFIEALQQSQRGVRVLELGTIDDVQRMLQRDDLGPATMRAIGEHYGVGAVVVGALDVEDVKPKVNIQQMFTAASVSAEVDASSTARLLETGRGATVWTRSARTTSTVAHVGVGGGSFNFDAKDPERAYGIMVDALVAELTRDFRATYVQQ